MTEENQGGTALESEANASTDRASGETVGRIAVADEPATMKTAALPDRSGEDPSEPPAAVTETASEDLRPAPEVVVADVVPEDAMGDIDVASAPPAEDPPVEVAVAEEPSSAPAETTVGSPEAGGPSEPAEPQASGIPGEVRTDAAEGVPVPTALAQSVSAEGAFAPPSVPSPVAVRDLGPEPTTMEELLAEQDSEIKSFKHGDVVEGSVVRIDKDEILVDIGAKSEGVVSNRELYGRHGETQPQLTIGDTVLVYVLQPESQEGHVVLSLRRAGLERKWRSMQEQFEAGVIIEAPVIDHNKGGLIVDCGIRGFVPISQIVDFPRRPQNDQPRDAAQEIAEKLQPFVGRKLRLKILEVNRKANRLILSEKVALYEERREKRDELFSSLQVGQRVKGTVRSIAPFGVFIDLGGIDGLVHKSELSWNKVNNPEAGYKVGDEVEAEVIDINHERGRISLSIRRLQPDPWHSTVADFKVGDVIDGTVTKLVNFGAFVRVRDGLEGLVHISELSHQRVAHPADVVHEGQALKLKIISLDSERHRLGLSLKQAEEPPARPAPEPVAPQQRAVPERRPRPVRSYSMADAVQEPEGGIDNTLAAAFAQVREQVAASEAAIAPETDAEIETAVEADTESETSAEAEVSAQPEASATAQPEATAVPADAEPGATAAMVEPEPAETTAEPETAEAPAEPEASATAEPEAMAAPADAEPGAAEAKAESQAAEATAEPETAETPAEPETAEAAPPVEPDATSAGRKKPRTPVVGDGAAASAAAEPAGDEPTA